ncbi:hypothetical protein COE51_15350 [Bacillus pseudomycoides]|nr:hypothetical protein COE51_15350 [Bacillus pseudomycoides]
MFRYLNEFIPLLVGSKTPTSRFGENEEAMWGITAGMRPIGSTNHQWGMKPPTDGSFTLYQSFLPCSNDLINRMTALMRRYTVANFQIVCSTGGNSVL